VKLYDKEGKEVDALTQEEIDVQLQQEKETAVAQANALREEEVNALYEEKVKIEAEKLALEEKLAGLQDKDKNFGSLRKAAETKDKEIELLRTKITEMETGFTKKVQDIETSKVQETKDQEIEKLAGQDIETKKKISFFYDQFVGGSETKEKIKEKVKNAYLLAMGGKAKVMQSDVISSSGGDVAIPNETIQQGKLSSPEVRDVAKKLGITDQELAKSGLI